MFHHYISKHRRCSRSHHLDHGQDLQKTVLALGAVTPGRRAGALGRSSVAADVTYTKIWEQTWKKISKYIKTME
jgi:hypothetical protein